MEQEILLKDSRLRIKKAGVYLFLFAVGLGSTTFVTGANLLVLLDFFLFSVLAFNLCYLLFLKRGIIRMKFPGFLLESQPGVPEIHLLAPLPPFAGTLVLHWKRFGESFQDRTSVLHFSEHTRALPLRFSIRGPYILEALQLEIEFPFPLFSLELKQSISMEVLVAPVAVTGEIQNQVFNWKSRDVEGEIHKIKTYTPGDPLKQVSWKHYAKFQELMVKEYDRVSLEEAAFVIKYTKENEKKVFSLALSQLQERMENLEPFLVIGQGSRFQFDGHLKDKAGLLRFLARYRTPREFSSQASVLGS